MKGKARLGDLYLYGGRQPTPTDHVSEIVGRIMGLLTLGFP